jgi:hypothetical protein
MVTAMTDHRPPIGTPIAVAHLSDPSNPYQRTITRHLGNWIYVGDDRFHVIDDKIKTGAWMNPEALFTIAS